MALGNLQSCSNVSSGHASCPGLPARSTETAVPSLSCPVLPVQPGAAARCPHPHLCSSAVLSWRHPWFPSALLPHPWFCQPPCQPREREQCPLMLTPCCNLMNSLILCTALAPRPCLPSSSSFSSAFSPQPTLLLLQIKALNCQASPVHRIGNYSEKLTIQVEAEAPACLFLFPGKHGLLLTLSLFAARSHAELSHTLMGLESCKLFYCLVICSHKLCQTG